MMQRLLLALLATTLSVPTGFAQTEVKKIDDSQLVSLYALTLESPDDEFLAKRIVEEREVIRNTIEEELNAIVAIPADEEQIESSGELSKALDRQRNIIRSLEERLRERKIDLDLLKAEEAKFYLEGGASTGAIAEFRTTKSHQGLLAKRAVLEERIVVLESLIPHQKERLNRLVDDQRMQQFGSLIHVGTYVLILIVIWLFEKLVRQFILLRIPNQSVRYSAVKFFSGGIYSLTILWILAVVYAKNPNILASFAIVGAGVAIAMQDVIKDIVGWIVIHQSRLFSQGDRVNIGGKTGEVIDMGLLHTKVLEIGIPPEGVLEQTGKVLSIPNAKVLTETLNNYNTTSDFVKAEICLTITFESNWKKTQEILTTLLQEETEEYAKRDQSQHSMRTRTMFVPYEPGASIVFKSIADDGVLFSLRFTVPVGKQRSVVAAISDRILDAIDENKDIELAYKTTRYFKRGE